jgi:hypothetical protein
MTYYVSGSVKEIAVRDGSIKLIGRPYFVSWSVSLTLTRVIYVLEHEKNLRTLILIKELYIIVEKVKGKVISLHAMEVLGVRGGIAPTHS